MLNKFVCQRCYQSLGKLWSDLVECVWYKKSKIACVNGEVNTEEKAPEDCLRQEEHEPKE